MKNLITGLLLAATFTLPAHAQLEARYLDGSTTANAYYDTTLNITWLADANLAASNTFGVSGILPGGLMRWTTAQSWIDAMNAANYLGYSDWSLPTTAPVNGTAFNLNYNVSSFVSGSTDVGYNVSAPGTAYAGSTGSEMANLFYDTLGNKAYFDVNGSFQSGYGLTNAGPFKNFQSAVYWSGTEYAPSTILAWNFSTLTGIQVTSSKNGSFYALAVRPGDVAAVPEPETYALLLAGLGLVGLRARRRG